MSNKDRVYFCVYFQEGAAGTNANPPVFHCGLWVESKGSRGDGHFFHVQYHGPRPTNRPNYPDGWAYDSSVMRSRPADRRRSARLIGRILIGKLLVGITAQHVHTVCQNVPLPGRNENCWDWARRAIQALQARRWIEEFGWRSFEADANKRAHDWYNRDRNMRRDHRWDMFGLDSHCTVM
ncbi:hypothetical protein C8A05DRAFT_19839 [Staphylotrichum tortipilum]|uniref:Uncharacterized protein n=1 Tax=Staphylotrichum tortipilum TaxID=2831512 RepID=A0AAN6MAU9_9PEZI|nr:hypothetical protein C8A05DRAFT_19839 [Staphylotrichum longicolle]